MRYPSDGCRGVPTLSSTSEWQDPRFSRVLPVSNGYDAILIDPKIRPCFLSEGLVLELPGISLWPRERL